jgi:hypothetical protein
VQLRNEMNSFDILFNTVTFFYNRDKGRHVLIFETKFPSEDIDAGYYVRYLFDSKHVVEYRMANDRHTFLSILSLAIGPHYFTPADFWDYENPQRFSLDASTEAIEHNLKLLDEFLIP